MTNIKKLGLSALAGSLVAFSANAAELSVAGGVELTYTDTGGNTGNEITGNSFGANSSVTMSGSGDVGFGTVSMTRTLNDTNTGWGSSFQTLDMGDMGILSFDSTAGALVGITANDDLLPTAYEEVSTGVSGKGVTGVGSTNVIGYRNTFGMFSVSAGYSNGGAAAQAESAAQGAGNTGSAEDIYVSAVVMDGLTIGAGNSTNAATNISLTSEDTEQSVANIVYSTGPVSVGYRVFENNKGTAGTASRSGEHYSIAFNVNDNFAISWGQQDTDVEAISATAAVTEEVQGISAAYTAGAASVRINHSTSDNDNGARAVDDETTEVSLVLSF
jgi:outer membrane protein OmpU